MKRFKQLFIFLFVVLFQFIYFSNDAVSLDSINIHNSKFFSGILTEESNKIFWRHNEPIKKSEPVSNTTIESQPVNAQPVDENKYIALTFDDGPNPLLTPQLINALKTYNAKATFFLVGSMAQNNPDIVKMIYDNGNEIGSHTYTHSNLIYLSDNKINNELRSTADLIMSITGAYPTLFRPPYGEHNQMIDNIAMAYNIPIILWNVDTKDWLYKDANYVYNYISMNLNDGNVILLHDIHPTSVEAAIRVIQDYSEKGYKFVTVSELFKIKNTTLFSGQSYCGIP